MTELSIEILKTPHLSSYRDMIYLCFDGAKVVNNMTTTSPILMTSLDDTLMSPLTFSPSHKYHLSITKSCYTQRNLSITHF